ncbi:hypothetical protein [Colwellia polaris]|jgi:hypothetical protein|uniref:hypothetical protein n=1 Tax=Colwellia polaris TaxID=326537 RepID=UPI000A173BAB|nr:hypothetical protein [Colwellia polaris]|tara:strand:- start:21449 stop:22093 length:645 start_codon:yes stop_codon:yes gene_type:complete
MTIKNQTLQIATTFILLFITFQSFAFEQKLPNKVIQENPITNIEKNNNFDSVFLNNYIHENKVTTEQLAIQSTEIKHLQNNFNKQVTKNEGLENQILSLKKQLYQVKSNVDASDNSSSIASVLLTAVAVIVTTLGVIIAVITFIGYKDIVQRAEDKAREITASLINKTANDEMTRLIDSGAFESHITQAVDRVVYKDLYADEELTNDDDTSVNK